MDTQQLDKIFQKLPRRRREVLEKLLAGESYPAIANSLGIAEGTLRKHISSLYEDFKQFFEFPDERRISSRDLVSLFITHKPELFPHLASAVPNTNGSLISLAQPASQEFQNDEIYVERPPIESICYETLLQPGSLLRIKAARRTGKTLLVARILAQLAQQGYRTGNLSLKLLDKTDLQDLDRFLQQFCSKVSRELQLPNQLKNWDASEGSKGSCTTYFEENLLEQVDTPVVLCLDDFDWVFQNSDIFDEFSALLRYWHERAKTRPIWKKLRLILALSTEVYGTLNIHHSPLDGVGIVANLPEFTLEQVQDFAEEYGLKLDAAQVEQLMKVVGGHPYLVQQALFHLRIRQDTTLEQLLKDAATEAGIYSTFLRENLLELQEQPELAQALKKVVTSTSPVRLETHTGHKLHSMGLVDRLGNEVMPSCDLYRLYFRERLEEIE
ncbi:MAG: DNA-binding protein [Symploca sp. SIO1A3]|nr:DNA-binding protein [Symploca sp. SIO1A3]